VTGFYHFNFPVQEQSMSGNGYTSWLINFEA